MCLKLCKTKKVKIKDGRIITIRRPKISDAKKVKEYVNSLIEEDAMIKINQKQTLKQETKWLKGILDDIKNSRKHAVLAEINGEIISFGELRKGMWRESHTASFGIGVKRDFRRLGVATSMLKYLIEIGKKDKAIRIMYLDVYAENKGAVKLYKKLGFKKVARLKKRVQYKGQLGDKLIMDIQW